MSDLSELIKITKNIESQNSEIIRLLKKIAGEDEEDDKLRKYKEMLSYTPDLGELYISEEPLKELKKEIPQKEETENKYKIGSLLNNPNEIGDVYFLENLDIFKLSVENDKTTVDNLTGDKSASDFSLQETIAQKCVENDVRLDDGTVILSLEQSQTLPETLKVCVEQDAKKVFMPTSTATQLVGAPDTLMTILKLNFYKSEDDLMNKLFQ